MTSGAVSAFLVLQRIHELMRQSMEVLISHVFPTSRWSSDTVHTWKSGHYFQGPVYLVFICSFGCSCRPFWRPTAGFWKATFSRTRARRPSGLYTAWDVVTCCLESIIYLSAALACSSRFPMTMLQYASCVRGLQNPRQIRGLQVQTLRRLPTSEVTA